jgi:dihydrofolate reductase
MGKLIYSAITSLDGYIEDTNGDFGWAAPDAEVHAFINDCERTVGRYLYGRRLYETMVYWETVPITPDESPIERDYTEIWRAADKIVYSTTLAADGISSARTRLERTFDPDSIAQMKAAAETDIGVGGPNLAAHAIRAGLVDEVHLYLTPIAIGSGKAALPDDGRVELELLDDRRFANGVVYLRYRTRTTGG